MYIKDNGLIDSEYESDSDFMPSLENYRDDDVEHIVIGDALVVRRILSTHVKDEILEQKGEHFSF